MTYKNRPIIIKTSFVLMCCPQVIYMYHYGKGNDTSWHQLQKCPQIKSHIKVIHIMQTNVLNVANAGDKC